MSNRKMTLKICIIGESGVGKTSLINRFTKDKFSSQYRITVGADLFSHEMNVDENEYSLQVNLKRFGTQLDKKNSNQLVLLFIEEVMLVC
jgi:GTPase SAR1 family protein